MTTNFRPPSKNSLPIFGVLKGAMTTVRARRRQWLWAAVALACSALTAATISKALNRAEQARAQLGTSSMVLVATVDIPAGSPIRAEQVELSARPVGQIPVTASRSLESVVGARTRFGVARREIVTSTALVRTAQSTLATRIPLGSIVAAIPLPSGSLVPSVGDRVDAYATNDSTGAGVGASPPTIERAQKVAENAEVLQVDAGVALITVDDAHAAVVTNALLRGQVALVMRPTG